MCLALEFFERYHALKDSVDKTSAKEELVKLGNDVFDLDKIQDALKEADDTAVSDDNTDEAPEGEDAEAAPEEKKEAPKASGFKVKFNAGKVKHYNSIPVLGNEGDLYKINKDGILVSVDNKTVFVNFEDIIES